MEQWYSPYIMSVPFFQINTLYYLLPFRPGKNCWNHQDEGNHFNSQTGQPRTFFTNILRAHGDSRGAAVGAGQMPAWKNKTTEEFQVLDNSTTQTTDLPHHILCMNLTAHGLTQVPLVLIIHIDLVLYREQSFLAGQHLLVFLFWGSSALWVVVGGRDSHLESGKLCLLCAALLLIRPTPPELCLWKLWWKEGDRVTIYAFLVQWQHQALGKIGKGRSARAVSGVISRWVLVSDFGTFPFCSQALGCLCPWLLPSPCIHQLLELH